MAELAVYQTLALVTEDCINCGITWGMTTCFQRERRDRGGTFYCPNGHGQHYTKTKVQELEAQLAAEKRWVEFERTQRQAAERGATAQRGQVTKLRNRIQRGVCPQCNRTFANHEPADPHPTAATGRWPRAADDSCDARVA